MSPPGNTSSPSAQRRRPRYIGRSLLVATAIAAGAAAPSASAAGAKPNDTYLSHVLNDRTTVGVNVLSGNLLLQHQDLSVKGRGLDLQIVRTYNSTLSPDNGLGIGWTVNTARGVSLESRSSGAKVLNYGDGSRYTFAPSSGGGFVTPNQIDADLTSAAGGGYALTFRQSRTVWRFSGSGILESMTDRNNNSIAYSSGGTVTDTHGRTFGESDSSTNNSRVHEDGTGREWTFELDGDYAVAEPDDVESNLVSFTDPEGNKYEYDTGSTSERIEQITTPGGRQAEVAYDSSGRVTTLHLLVDAASSTEETWEFDYGQTDSRCANLSLTVGVTKVTDPRGHVTSYCRDTTGGDAVVLDTIDPNGNHQSRTFNTQGRLEAQGTGSVLTNTTYNANGTIADQQLPEGEKSTWDYTGTGAAQYQPSKITNADGKNQFFGYDANGNITSASDAANPANATLKATLTHNPDGTIATATDGENRQTAYGYYGPADGTKNGSLKYLNRPTVPSPAVPFGTEFFDYDPLGRVTSYTDGRGKETSYEYDKLDRTTKITFDDSSTITYSYDDDGNQTQRTDSSGGTYTYAYDGRNRRTTETLPGSRTVSYSYDAGGNLKTLQDGSGTTLYGYDPAGRVCFAAQTTSTTGSCSNPPSSAITFEHDDRGNRIKTTYPNGTAIDRVVDDSDKPTAITAKRGGTTLLTRTWGYKDFGAGRTGALVSTTSGGNAHSYSYDSAGRLSGMQYPGSSGLDQRYYDYDKSGNRTASRWDPTSTGDIVAETTYDREYEYNAANQLVKSSSTAQGVIPPAATTFTYDAAGNDQRHSYNDRNQTTALGGTVLAYAGPNQAELIAIGADTIENNQLGVGRRIAGGNATSFIRDPEGTLLARKSPTGAMSYYVHDNLGSVIATTNAAGNVTKSIDYDPDGNPWPGTPDAPDDFGYTGALLVGTGTDAAYHNTLRFYDPKTARWTQPDPLDVADDARNANPYQYVGSDPVNYTDPNGTWVPFAVLAARCATNKACRKLVLEGKGVKIALKILGLD